LSCIFYMPTILPRRQHILQGVFGSAIGWTRMCSSSCSMMWEYDTYFLMKKYVIEIPCFSSIHEYPVSMRMIAYADRVDTTNKYLARVNQHPLKPCTSSGGWLWYCLDYNI
jgi:hypothetical protein